MNRLSNAKRTQVVAALVEGNSSRATVRMTGVAKNTVVKLLVELGAACDKYQRETLVGLRSKRIQCDEIWSFVYAKAKNGTPEMAAAKDGRGTCGRGPRSIPIPSSSCPGSSGAVTRATRGPSWRTSRTGLRTACS